MVTVTDAGGTVHAGNAGAVLSDILLEKHRSFDLPCAGRGTCLKCGVRIEGRLSPPTAQEQARFAPAELQNGWRLACQVRVLGDARLVWAPDTSIIQTADTGAVPPAVHAPLYRRWGVAVDIGTTTLCARLLGPSGWMSGTVAAKNPQAAYGADVISRIGEALAGQGPALRRAVREAVGRLVCELANRHGISPREIDAAVLAGNTTMLYLLTGHDPEPLARAPFAADRLFGETLPAAALDIGMDADGIVYLPRCVSAFVGGDIVTALLASGITCREETSLLMDLGTNGELALWHRGKLSVCSTATGPAFEGQGISRGVYAVPGAIDRVWTDGGAVRWSTIGGAPAVGICGSGILDALAVMLETGAIKKTGAFRGKEGFSLGDIPVTAADVRNLQVAKSAVRAGTETLLETAGVRRDEIASLYIAGGFGRFLNLHSAAAIGLLPPQWTDRAVIIGNASLAGAAMLLQSHPLIAEGQSLADSAQTVALDANPVFQEKFYQFLKFKADTFPPEKAGDNPHRTAGHGPLAAN